jgi:hypothetical protein
MHEYKISVFSIDFHDRKDGCVKGIFIPKYRLWRNVCLFNFIFSLQKWAECFFRCRFRRRHILGPRFSIEAATLDFQTVYTFC